jgi:FlaG/FlaF family flagellin (archaellin)
VIGLAISLILQLVTLMISLTILAVRLMIRGSIVLAATIASLIEERGRNSAASRPASRRRVDHQ